jgi:hypothetical protein
MECSEADRREKMGRTWADPACRLRKQSSEHLARGLMWHGVGTRAVVMAVFNDCHVQKGWSYPRTIVTVNCPVL